MFVIYGTILLIAHLITLGPALCFQKDAVILGSRCGKTFTERLGNYTYPENYPHAPYPFGLKCRWMIKSPTKVHLTFPYFVLRTTDFVVLMDGTVKLGAKPCDPRYYSKEKPSEAETQDHLRVLRGSEMGNMKDDIVFSPSDTTVVIDFCPSRFPFGTVKGLGIIFFWEDASPIDPLDLSEGSGFGDGGLFSWNSPFQNKTASRNLSQV